MDKLTTSHEETATPKTETQYTKVRVGAGGKVHVGVGGQPVCNFFRGYKRVVNSRTEVTCKRCLEKYMGAVRKAEEQAAQ